MRILKMNIRTDTSEENLANWYASLKKSQKEIKDRAFRIIKLHFPTYSQKSVHSSYVFTDIHALTPQATSSIAQIENPGSISRVHSLNKPIWVCTSHQLLPVLVRQKNRYMTYSCHKLQCSCYPE